MSSEIGVMTRLEVVSATSRMPYHITNQHNFEASTHFQAIFGYFICEDLENRTALKKTGKLAAMSFCRHRGQTSPQLQKSEVSKTVISVACWVLLLYQDLTKATRRAVQFNEKSGLKKIS